MKLDSRKTASIDVDAQKGFSPLCPNELPVPDGHHIVDALNEQAKLARYRICTKDWHPYNSLHIACEMHPQFTPIEGFPNMDMYWNQHCIAGTEGAELLPGLPKESEYDFVVYKGLEKDMHPYGACYHDLAEKQPTGLIQYLLYYKIDTVIVSGLATDFCVAKTAIQLAQTTMFRIIVNLPACRAIGDTTKTIEEFKKYYIEIM